MRITCYYNVAMRRRTRVRIIRFDCDEIDEVVSVKISTAYFLPDCWFKLVDYRKVLLIDLTHTSRPISLVPLIIQRQQWCDGNLPLLDHFSRTVA